jgi:hypothetical protein
METIFHNTDRDPACPSTTTTPGIPISKLEKVLTKLLITILLQNPIPASLLELHVKSVAKLATKH